MAECMLSTVDNPYSPFTQWDEWLTYDEQRGYHTCAYLDRVTVSSDKLSDVDQDQAIQDGIDDIVEHDPTGLYIKVFRD